MIIRALTEYRHPIWRGSLGLALAGVGFALFATVQLRPDTAVASAETRTLTLYNPHNKEDLTVTYKRDGKFEPEELRKLDWFMRDWRQNEQKKMDPKLFDILWELYRDMGSQQPIHLVSGYRSPKTNAMLRRRSRGVARRSRHMLGQAADVYFPDVSTKRLREVALVMQRGGVGYYPRSGKYGFVHVDTGRIRHWPRMNPIAMARLFKRRDLLINRHPNSAAPTRIAGLGGATGKPTSGTAARLSIAGLIASNKVTAKTTARGAPNNSPVTFASLQQRTARGPVSLTRPRAPIVIARRPAKAVPAPVPLIKPAAIRRRNFAAHPPVPLRKPVMVARLRPAADTLALDPAAAPLNRANLELARRGALRKFIAPVATRHAKGDRLDIANPTVIASLDGRKYVAPARRTIVNRAAKGDMLMSFQVRPKPRRTTKSDRSASHRGSTSPNNPRVAVKTN